MAELLTQKQIISAISQRTGATEGRVEKILDALEELIIEEVAFHDGFRLNHIGTIRGTYKEGEVRRVRGVDTYITPRIRPTMKFSSSFKELLKRTPIVKAKGTSKTMKTVKSELQQELATMQMMNLLDEKVATGKLRKSAELKGKKKK